MPKIQPNLRLHPLTQLPPELEAGSGKMGLGLGDGERDDGADMLIAKASEGELECVDVGVVVEC